MNNILNEKIISFKDGRAIFSFEIKLSEKRRIDKDSGYLYCDEAIFGHTGVQEYYASEIGMKGNDIVKVHRFADDVFNDEAMASIEGKSVTREHPAEMVTSKNSKNYDVGTILKVWRDGENVIGNIVIKDMETIEDITEHRMEALSLGYKANLIPLGNGEYKQTDLRINHLAVVKAGRARNARIMDENTIRKEKPKMGMFDWLTGRKIRPNSDGTITIMDEEIEKNEENTKKKEKEEKKEKETVLDIRDEESSNEKIVNDAKYKTTTKTVVEETSTYDDETNESDSTRKTEETRKTSVEKDEDEEINTVGVTDEEKNKDEKESEVEEPIMTEEQRKAFKDEMLKELMADIKKNGTVFDDVQPTETQTITDDDGSPQLKLNFEQDEKLRKTFWDLYTNPTAHSSIKEFNEFRKKANKKFAV